MGYYINCIKTSETLTHDFKELVPDMNMRRRMSRIVKMGVTTGLDALLDFSSYGNIDAIITATGLGCIADSEKFLTNIISNNEQMLNPTPFINSTFNTVGAQIALIQSLHCYNNTFTHRTTSFESALLDAILRLSTKKSKAVLVGVFDEITPTLLSLMTRMGKLKTKCLGEGAVFFILTNDRLDVSVAEIEELSFGETSNSAQLLSEISKTMWCGAMAQSLVQSINLKNDGSIINDSSGKSNPLIKFRCIS